MAASNYSYDFFISRTGSDREIAKNIGRILESAGYRILLQDWDFGNSDFVSKMDWALKECRRVITVLSNAYLESDYCGAEWRCIFREDPRNWGERLLLFRVDQCSPKGLLGLLAYLDLVPIVDLPEILRDVILAAVTMDHRPREAKIVEPYRREFTPIVDPSIRTTPNFVGRTDLMGQIQKALNSGSEVCVLKGMPGSGKSTIASRFALDSRKDYGGVWLIDGSDEKILHQGFISLGRLFLPELTAAKDTERTATSVLNNVIPHFKRPWLLIFDGVESPELLRRWLPRQGAKVLATSRRTSWGLDVSVVEVRSFELDDAIRYLATESGRREIDEKRWQPIAKAVGRLPLALAHIAAFMRRKRTVSGDRLLERLAEVLASSQLGSESSAVDATIKISVEEVCEQIEECRPILEFISFFATTAIPIEFLQQTPTLYPPYLATSLSDRSRVEDALGLLDELSLIRFYPEHGTFDVHLLVQDFVRPDGDRATEMWRVAQKIANDLYAGARDDPEQAARFGPHAWQTDKLSHRYTGNLELRKIATDASRIFHELSDQEWLEQVNEQESKIANAEAESGPVSEEARSCWNQFALRCSWRGDHERHQKAWRRATEILIALDADPNRIIKHVNNYCSALEKGGRKRWQISEAAAELGYRVPPFDSDYLIMSFELDPSVAGMDVNDVKSILKEVEGECSADPQQFLMQIKEILLERGCHAGVVRELVHYFARTLDFPFKDHLILSPPLGTSVTPEEIAQVVFAELHQPRALSDTVAAISENLRAQGVTGECLHNFIRQIALQLGVQEPTA